MTRLQRELHRRTWLAMLVLIPFLCILALHLRRTRSLALGAAHASVGAKP